MCRSSSITSSPLASVARCTAGNVHVGRLAERRQHVAIEVVCPGCSAGIRRHHQRVVRRVEPLAGSASRTSAAVARGHALEAIEVAVRRAVVGHALGEDVGPAAEAAQPLGAAREVGEDAAARALQLGLGRAPASAARRPRRSISRSTRAGSTPSFTVAVTTNRLAELARLHAGGHRRGQLLRRRPAADRAARCASRSARWRTSSSRCDVGVAPRRRVIDAVDARLRHAVLHLVAHVARRAAAPTARARSSGGPGGMPPKYFFTSSSARSGVMSPASDSTQLFGP